MSRLRQRASRMLRNLGPVRAGAALVLLLALAGGLSYLFLARGGDERSAAAGKEADPRSCVESLRRDYACYEKYLTSILEGQGGEAALAQLASLSTRSSYVLAQCHPLAHAIGRAAYDFYGTVNEANRHGDGTCWSGYFHGAMERYMFQFDDQELLALMPTICKPTPGHAYSFDFYNCIHGLGHGVTWRFNNDIFKALPFCDALDGAWQQSSCASGAFMQNIVVDGQMHRSVNLKPGDPVYPCNAVATKYKQSCYLMQTSYILRVLDYDYRKAFRICEGVDAGLVKTCYRSMGRDISGNSHRDSEKILELCSLGRPDLQGQCFAGAAKNDVFNDHGTVRADELCSLVPEAHRADCVQARNEAAATL